MQENVAWNFALGGLVYICNHGEKKQMDIWPSQVNLRVSNVGHHNAVKSGTLPFWPSASEDTRREPATTPAVYYDAAVHGVTSDGHQRRKP